MKQQINIVHFGICEMVMFIGVEGIVYDCDSQVRPRVLLWFQNEKEDRSFTLRITDLQYDSEGRCKFQGGFYCFLDRIFWKTREEGLPFTLHMDFICGKERQERVEFQLDSRNMIQRWNEYEVKVNGRTGFTFRPLEMEESFGERFLRRLKKAKTHALLIVGGIIGLPWGAVELMASLFGIVLFEGKRRTVYEKKANRMPLTISDRIFDKYNRILRRLKKAMLRVGYYGLCKLPKKEKSVAFVSQRNTSLEGNFKFVYHELKEKHPEVKIRLFLNTKTVERMTYRDIADFCKACAFSQAVLVDEYVPSMYTITLKPSTKLIQLWHACGAFKTFGFSRIGRPGAPAQKSKVHRNYDYVAVSSSNVRLWYAQGFGLPMKAIKATGVPRTDVFSDPAYAAQVKKEFYEQYPHLRGKKVLLFAPTFRGNGKESAYYPMERFQPGNVYEQLGGEYAILIKQHPFVRERMEIPEKYKDFILDMSKFPEINDLLFVSDLVITDYSSLIFEASLLNLPMLFYVYDLEEYTRDRDFYFDFAPTVPGKKVFTQEELIQAIQDGDFEQEKVKPFAETYFDDLDGKATERVVDLIMEQL